MPIYALGDDTPEIAGSAFVAPDANVIGRVSLGESCGVWFGATLRGDREPIHVGARTNVQEGAVLHTDMGFPLTIGEGVTIGHGAIVHGCTIGDNSLIGMGAIVMNGARIGRNSIVGAGALVTENKTFPDNSLIVGAPARAAKTLDAEAETALRRSAESYVENAARFRSGLKPVG